MVCSRSRPEYFEVHRDLAKNSISQIEEWATKCLVKAKKLRNDSSGDKYNLEKAQHLEMEADYWFGLAEQMRREENFQRDPKFGKNVIKFKEQKP